jgi:hypothetical protein
MKVCKLSARYGRDTPCWFNCGTFCKRTMQKRPGYIVPSDLTNLAAWYQFNTGITEAGQGVSQWDDQSGNGRHLKQGTDGSRPVKQSDGSILFNGSDEHLQTDAFTFDQPATVYWLGKQVTWTDTDRLWDGISATFALFQNTASPQLRVNAGAGLGNISGPAIDTYGVVSVVLNGASSVLQLNNSSTVSGNAGTNNAGGFTLGSGVVTGTPALFSNSQVKEVLLYSEAHNAETRTKVISYLNRVAGF